MSRRTAIALQAMAALIVIVLLAVLIAGVAGDDDTGDGVATIDAASIYQARCADCHGSDGQGGSGPPLGGGAVVARFPDVADQIAVVKEGRLSTGMPGFDAVLSDDEIEAVVEYTRSR